MLYYYTTQHVIITNNMAERESRRGGCDGVIAQTMGGPFKSLGLAQPRAGGSGGQAFDGVRVRCAGSWRWWPGNGSTRRDPSALSGARCSAIWSNRPSWAAPPVSPTTNPPSTTANSRSYMQPVTLNWFALRGRLFVVARWSSRDWGLILVGSDLHYLRVCVAGRGIGGIVAVRTCDMVFMECIYNPIVFGTWDG